MVSRTRRSTPTIAISRRASALRGARRLPKIWCYVAAAADTLRTIVSTSVGPAASLGFGDTLSLVAATADTTWALALRNGFPVYTRPSLSSAGFGAVPLGAKTTTAVTFFDRARPSPVSYQFSFDLQDENRARTWCSRPAIAIPAAPYSGRPFPSIRWLLTDACLGPGNTQGLRPFPQFSNVSIINPRWATPAITRDS